MNPGQSKAHLVVCTMIRFMLFTVITFLGFTSGADYTFIALIQPRSVRDFCQFVSSQPHPWWRKVRCQQLGPTGDQFELKIDQSDVWGEYVSRPVLAGAIARGLSYPMGKCGLSVGQTRIRVTGVKKPTKCPRLQQYLSRKRFPWFRCEVKRGYQDEFVSTPNGQLSFGVSYYKLMFRQPVDALEHFRMQVELNKDFKYCRFNAY
ncbi:hypothetical protein CRM22_003299 [Opisthorchis felineus]|uniref:Uncharacterized protein n=1 Tax=Opisthorchis felineus TaxID=147828 RepID=A0A4S2M2K5_OPIFE|nr:hypothetical protein CRM22_003299 [Opisthorchis felineus]